MGRVDDERLNRLLGHPELAWVLERVRRRIELGRPLNGTIARRAATATERDAIAHLFGRPPRAARGLSVSLDELDALLRRSGVHADGLAGAVVSLTGPVTIRVELAAHDARAWAKAFRQVELAAVERPALASWIDHIRRGGLVKRLAGSEPEAARDLLLSLIHI